MSSTTVPNPANGSFPSRSSRLSAGCCAPSKSLTFTSCSQFTYWQWQSSGIDISKDKDKGLVQCSPSQSFTFTSCSQFNIGNTSSGIDISKDKDNTFENDRQSLLVEERFSSHVCKVKICRNSCIFNVCLLSLAKKGKIPLLCEFQPDQRKDSPLWQRVGQKLPSLLMARPLQVPFLFRTSGFSK